MPDDFYIYCIPFFNIESKTKVCTNIRFLFLLYYRYEVFTISCLMMTFIYGRYMWDIKWVLLFQSDFIHTKESEIKLLIIYLKSLSILSLESINSCWFLFVLSNRRKGPRYSFNFSGQGVQIVIFFNTMHKRLWLDSYSFLPILLVKLAPLFINMILAAILTDNL